MPSEIATLPCIGAVKAGERVVIQIDTAGNPTVIGTVGSGDRTEAAVQDASAAASEAQSLAESVSAHTWTDAQGTHVTSFEQADSSTANGYETVVSASGSAAGSIINRVVNGVRKMLASFTQSGIAFYDGGDVPKLLGRFGSDGMQVYSNDSAHTPIANLGYGEGKDEQGGTSYKPYYTLGVRGANSVVGNYSFAHGKEVEASGAYSFSEGHRTVASGYASHAEGESSASSGHSSHAEGSANASGYSSHAEGSANASGNRSHAEGTVSIAYGESSHAEGYNTRAYGESSHVEGSYCSASGKNAHAEGTYTMTSCEAQHAAGKYNVHDDDGEFARIVGNGTGSASKDRSNAEALDWDGNLHLNGDVYTGCNADSTGGTSLNSALAGKADAAHVHNAADITSGTLPIANGGTGAATANAAVNELFTNTTEAQAQAFLDTDMLMTNAHNSGVTSDTTWRKRRLSELWTWVKGHADSTYMPTGAIVMESVQAASTTSVAANSMSANITFSIDKDGYTPLGIVGTLPGNSTVGSIIIASSYLNGNTANVRCYNVTASAKSPQPTVRVLYVKN